MYHYYFIDFRIFHHLVKNPDGTDIFNPCGEFRWCPEDTVSQIHSPHIHVDAPGIFSDLLRAVQMLKREWVRKATGSYRTCSLLDKTAALVPEFAVEDPPSVELQPWFLHLLWRTCLWTEHWWWLLLHCNIILFLCDKWTMNWNSIETSVLYFSNNSHMIIKCTGTPHILFCV